jgi:predicted hydrocarbon binding protein
MIGREGGRGATTAVRDLAIPVTALTHLRQALRKEVGALEATHTLHDAGFAAGGSLFEQFVGMTKTAPASLDPSRFWETLSRFFESRGWGRISQERIHPGLGVIRAREWAECDPAGDETQPGCAFTAGVLAHLLGRVAEGPVAVLEVACGSRGDEACEFLFGSEGVIHEVYGHLLNGRSLDSVLRSL